MIIYSDAENVVYYDTNRRSYLWFLKTQWYDCRRSIGRAETRDFRHWPLAETIIHPGADLHPSDDWYTNSKTRYPGTTDHHFLVSRPLPSRRRPRPTSTHSAASTR